MTLGGWEMWWMTVILPNEFTWELTFPLKEGQLSPTENEGDKWYEHLQQWPPSITPWTQQTEEAGALHCAGESGMFQGWNLAVCVISQGLSKIKKKINKFDNKTQEVTGVKRRGRTWQRDGEWEPSLGQRQEVETAVCCAKCQHLLQAELMRNHLTTSWATHH